jgi:CBS domain-containing protein
MTPVLTVRADDSVGELARAFAAGDLRAVAVVTEGGQLVGILTDEDLLDALLPAYVGQDKALARLLAQADAAELLGRIEGKRVSELVQASRREHPTASPDSTLVEVLSAVCGTGASAVLVIEAEQVLGVITVDRLLRILLSPKSE